MSFSLRNSSLVSDAGDATGESLLKGRKNARRLDGDRRKELEISGEKRCMYSPLGSSSVWIFLSSLRFCFSSSFSFLFCLFRLTARGMWDGGWAYFMLPSGILPLKM